MLTDKLDSTWIILYHSCMFVLVLSRGLIKTKLLREARAS